MPQNKKTTVLDGAILCKTIGGYVTHLNNHLHPDGECFIEIDFLQKADVTCTELNGTKYTRVPEGNRDFNAMMFFCSVPLTELQKTPDHFLKKLEEHEKRLRPMKNIPTEGAYRISLDLKKIQNDAKGKSLEARKAAFHR